MADREPEEEPSWTVSRPGRGLCFREVRGKRRAERRPTRAESGWSGRDAAPAGVGTAPEAGGGGGGRRRPSVRCVPRWPPSLGSRSPLLEPSRGWSARPRRALGCECAARLPEGTRCARHRAARPGAQAAGRGRLGGGPQAEQGRGREDRLPKACAPAQGGDRCCDQRVSPQGRVCAEVRRVTGDVAPGCGSAPLRPPALLPSPAPARPYAGPGAARRRASRPPRCLRPEPDLPDVSEHDLRDAPGGRRSRQCGAPPRARRAGNQSAPTPAGQSAPAARLFKEG